MRAYVLNCFPALLPVLTQSCTVDLFSRVGEEWEEGNVLIFCLTAFVHYRTIISLGCITLRTQFFGKGAREGQNNENLKNCF